MDNKQTQGLHPVAFVCGVLVASAIILGIVWFDQKIVTKKAAPSGAVSVSGQAVPIGVQMRNADVPFLEGRAYNVSTWLTERCLAGHQFIVSDHGRTVTQILGENGGGIKCPK